MQCIDIYIYIDIHTFFSTHIDKPCLQQEIASHVPYIYI